VSEITTIMRMLDRIAVGRLMRDVGTMGMGRAESALLARRERAIWALARISMTEILERHATVTERD
jgi:hypothetical protein